MATTQDLITIKVHTDDDTGMYYVGEMDYGVPSTTEKWLKGERNGKTNRETLAEWLEHLAESCRNQHPPFGNNHRQSTDDFSQCEARK